jgi:hypothetical protein
MKLDMALRRFVISSEADVCVALGTQIARSATFFPDVIPAKAGIHLALASEQRGFPLSRE